MRIIILCMVYGKYSLIRRNMYEHVTMIASSRKTKWPKMLFTSVYLMFHSRIFNTVGIFLHAYMKYLVFEGFIVEIGNIEKVCSHVIKKYKRNIYYVIYKIVFNCMVINLCIWLHGNRIKKAQSKTIMSV